MKILLYKDSKKEYRWRLIAKNGRILADSGEGYKRKAAMDKAIITVFGSADLKFVDNTK